MAKQSVSSACNDIGKGLCGCGCLLMLAGLSVPIALLIIAALAG